MIRSHKIRLNPTPDQDIYFHKACGTARFVYNWGLAEWKRHKAENPGEEYGPMALKKQFNSIKGERFPWVYDVAKDVVEGAFANLSTALKNYFESKNGNRKGWQIGFPKFKSKKQKHQSFRLNNDRFHAEGHRFYVPKLGWVNMAEKLRYSGKILGAVVSCNAGRWYVSISVEMNKPPPRIFPNKVVGIDVGIKTLLVLSDKRQYENQALLRSELNHLRRLSRRLSRRKMGSGRWEKAKLQLGRFHRKIANRRMDYLHKVTTDISRKYQTIGLEDLIVAGMVRNHRLALSLSDASFGEIRRQLTYKSEGYGGQVILVNRFYPSSKRCSHCGSINTELQLKDREWTCKVCGVRHDRDINAARNIEIETLRILTQPPAVATSGTRLVDGM